LSAVARLDYVNPKTFPDQDLVAQIAGERGGVPALYQMLLHSPPVAFGWLKLGTGVRHQAKLNGVIRELTICLVGKLLNARYEYAHHAPVALREGATQAQLEALERWRDSDLFDTRQKAALAYAEQITRHVEVPDQIFKPVRDHFDDRELVELTTTIGFYNLVCRFLVAMRIEDEDQVHR
jgi:alkylhydroperoxidase family enzyme